MTPFERGTTYLSRPAQPGCFSLKEPVRQSSNSLLPLEEAPADERGGGEDHIDSEAKIEARDNQGWTPLQLAAAFSETPEVIRFLIKEGGTNLMARDKRGRTLLHLAAIYNNSPEAVEALLLDFTLSNLSLFHTPKGIDAVDSRDWTPLQYAARYSKSADIVKLFLDAGANPMGAIFSSDKPVDLIQQNEHLRDSDLYWDLLNKSF